MKEKYYCNEIILRIPTFKSVEDEAAWKGALKFRGIQTARHFENKIN